MLKRISNLDTFGKNILFVFLGTSLVNFFNLLYQLLLAHSLDPADFAAINSLFSIFMILSAPLFTLQLALAKYCAEFNARKQIYKIKFLISDILKKITFFALATLLLFGVAAVYLVNLLKIESVTSGYILAILLALTWLVPVFTGALQGLELFAWLAFVLILASILKLILAYFFIVLGYKISGALSALLIGTLVSLGFAAFPLKRYISSHVIREDIPYKEIIAYLFPVALANFCFYMLVTFDMVLVKHFFSPFDAGIYSLAQMAGKCFLFLPAAISLVMFPRVSGLNADNKDTTATLKKSLFYTGILCIAASLVYNLFPDLVMRLLTGKVFPESIFLGRLFGISMSFFALLYILVTYFLSLKDLRFLKYLLFFSVVQCLAIFLFHKNLARVQSIICVNAVLLFFILFSLLNKKAGFVFDKVR